MDEPKLNQVIAVEKSAREAHNKEKTALHRKSSTPGLFNGLTKVYTKKDDDGEDFPAEKVKVQARVDDVIREFCASHVDALNVVATKDYGNQDASADVMVNGAVIIKDAPVTYLLFLEKELVDFKTFVMSLPELDESLEWSWDEEQSLWRSDEITTHKTKKVQKPIVLYPHSVEHPAQTEMITEDMVVGHWATTKLSGAIPVPEKRRLADKVTLLQRAVKYAREEANSTKVPNMKVGKPVMDFLLKKEDTDQV
jgi:hypothetical protein